VTVTISEIIDTIVCTRGPDDPPVTCVGPLQPSTVVHDVAALHRPIPAAVDRGPALSWWDGLHPFPDAWAQDVVITHHDVLTPRHAGALIRCANPRLAITYVLRAHFKTYVPPQWRPELPAAYHHFPVRCHPTARIAASAVLGAEGQAFVWGGERHLAIPHLYGVHIGAHTTVGHHTTIQRGVLADTVVGDDVHLGQAVNIGHGVRIGAHTVIPAHACIGGSAVIGAHVFVGMGAIIKNGIRVGDDAVVGAGAVVCNDVPEGVTVAGVPARLLCG
jgi:acetyltransferase-like isoleucine patch superfamily enzyme